MLDHTHADHTVELHARLPQISVIHQLHFQEISQTFSLNLLLELPSLFLAQCDAHSMDFIFSRCLPQQETPAAANVQKTHPLLQVEFVQNMVHLVDLSLIQGILIRLKIAAGITHGLVQPQLIEIVADVVVGADLLPLAALTLGSVEQTAQGILVCGEFCVWSL